MSNTIFNLGKITVFIRCHECDKPLKTMTFVSPDSTRLTLKVIPCKRCLKEAKR